MDNITDKLDVFAKKIPFDHSTLHLQFVVYLSFFEFQFDQIECFLQNSTLALIKAFDRAVIIKKGRRWNGEDEIEMVAVTKSHRSKYGKVKDTVP